MRGIMRQRKKKPNCWPEPEIYAMLFAGWDSSGLPQDGGLCHKLHGRSGSARHRFLVPGHSPVYSLYGDGRQLSIVPVLFAKSSAIIFAFGNAPIGRIDTGGNETMKCRIRPFRCASG